MMPTRPIVIAHRGASGYLPEHTLAAKALAHAMGAGFLEQDVVLSRDGIPVVLHDIHLDSTTNVAQRFATRARADGHFYAIDFSLEEIRQLQVHERSCLDASGGEVAVFPGRFPLPDRFTSDAGLFRIPTLAEEIDLIAGLDRSRNCSTGLYVELKSPNWHKAQGQNLAGAVLEVLEDKGYADRPGQVFLQCFDDKTLRHLRHDLKTALPLIQLISENDRGEDSEVDYDYLQTPRGLAYITSYADGIGPWLAHIFKGRNEDGTACLSQLVAQAQAQGLLVHPYTFRRDELPEGITSFSELLDIFILQAGIDGLFTDFPDIVSDYLQQHQDRLLV
ncbi:MAG: glycerophosphodiester phosphodiesterase [Gammaproteobacteria bacterium]|nr:MAG: glycerophosphodiester phosphodiesterase [Gammaproteobacteria bacterium]RLA57145.1 MAG: glycerophosphodiester phosphodiesterase [Gammaproteobacteria bacterium]HDY82045.1 glycerophosphodiester phosphodiesterase [Halieaceae bacterium]